MTQGWALVLDAVDRAAAGSLLGLDVEVLEIDERVWLRGPTAAEDRMRRLLGVPARRRYVVSDGAVFPVGRKAPEGTLPDGDWRPLVDWLRVRPTVAMLPGDASDRPALRLVFAPSAASPVEPSALSVEFAVWARYAETAPAVRLARWSFAVDGDRALVVGRPLPPIPGIRLVVHEDVFAPAGMTWSPPLAVADVRRILGARAGEFVLWLPGRAVEVAPKSAFVACSRSAVRSTAEARDG
jgi:hypothetical protein